MIITMIIIYSVGHCFTEQKWKTVVYFREREAVKKKTNAEMKQPRHDRDQCPNNKEGSHRHTCDGNGPEDKEKAEYFAEDEGSQMTVFFHAVLAPFFKFDAQKGDRIFMRFGGAPFGDFKKDVVEVFIKRYGFVVLRSNQKHISPKRLFSPYMFRTMLRFFSRRSRPIRSTENYFAKIWNQRIQG